MKFDEIGYWSEVKLDILRDYAGAYSRILSARQDPSLHHVYIDGFCGAGTHIAKSTGEAVAGSPLVALEIEPPFREYFLLDMDGAKVSFLRGLVGDRSDIHVLEGDCNRVLPEQVFPKVTYQQYRRGLCVLDPYGLHLDWKVIEAAGALKTLDLFLNFPVMDMNRNALWRNPEGVDPADRARMTAFWGDESWESEIYRESKQIGLFGDETLEKASNDEVAEAFRNRLRKVAGFERVPAPLPMRNRNNAVVYYLFFASQKPVAEGIVKHIFKKYEHRRS